jgi:HPt (histidine-containing phosphotransfer) domain-containing protein
MRDAIDLARLRTLFSDDEPGLLELLHATADETRSVFEKLRDAVVDSDAASAAAAAHELKGFAGNVGAAGVAQLSAQIESEIKARRWLEATAACSALGTEVERVTSFVAAYVDDSKANIQLEVRRTL